MFFFYKDSAVSNITLDSHNAEPLNWILYPIFAKNVHQMAITDLSAPPRTIRLSKNPAPLFSDDYANEARVGIDPSIAHSARDELRTWPVYAETPLVDLAGFAALAGVRQVLVKDEGQREPLNSFKALGGAYALGEGIRDLIEARSHHRPTYEDLFAGAYSDQVKELCAFAATDGNHGRSLAWGASLFGCACQIFTPRGVSERRKELIRSLGATVTGLDGNYEYAVETARERSDAHGAGMFIQDTSDETYQLPCQRIMHGYTLLSEEARLQLGSQEPPTHVFVHIGCGGLAAAVAADLWLAYGSQRPKIIGIEPLNADSFRRSIQKGELVEVGGNHETVMIGLAVGEVSAIAWPILKRVIDYSVALDDRSAIEVLNLCAEGVNGDPPMIVGETGGAGLAALLDISRDEKLRKQIELDENSRVLTINTEGAVDQVTYDRLRESWK